MAAARLTLTGAAALAVAGFVGGCGGGTSGPRTSETSPAAVGPRCVSRVHRFRVSYPAGWFATSGNADLACRFFNPVPLEVPEHADKLGIAVSVLPDQGPYRRVLLAALNPPNGRVVSRGRATVDGRRAVVIETEATGVGFYPVGSRQYMYLIDVGGVGVIVGTLGFTGEKFARYRRVVDAMVPTLHFLPGVRPGAAART